MTSGKRSLVGYGLLVMTVTHTLTHVFGRLYTATFPLLQAEFSLTLTELAVLAAIPHLFDTLVSIPAGLLSDRFGSKRMLLVSMAFAVLGSFLAAVTASPLMLAAAATLVYLNTTVYHPASYTFTTRLFPIKDLPKALGVHGAGGTFGMALGPITLSLFGLLGLTWRHVYFFWALPLVVGTLLVLRLRETDAPKDVDTHATDRASPTAEATSLLSRGMMIFLVYTSIRTVAGQIITIFMPLFMVDAKGLTMEQMGFVYGSLPLTGLLAAPVGGFIASRVGPKRWLIASILMSESLLALVWLAPTTTLFIVLYVANGFAGTLGMAARSSLVAALTPRSRRGVGYSLLFLPGSVMGAIAPLFATNIITLFGMEGLFPISILFSLIGVATLAFGVQAEPSA
jgi:MFS family permease